jgi:hypothetical protein
MAFVLLCPLAETVQKRPSQNTCFAPFAAFTGYEFAVGTDMQFMTGFSMDHAFCESVRIVAMAKEQGG